MGLVKTHTQSSTQMFQSGADLQGGLGGIKPPYLPKTHGYPSNPPLIFEMKQWRRREEEEEEKGRKKKKKKMDMSPLYIFELDSPLIIFHRMYVAMDSWRMQIDN